MFIQNGMLQPWLDAVGLGDNTQVLVYFAVAKKGEKPTDGKTDVNPEGLTAAHGPHAAAVAAMLHSGGLSCKVGGFASPPSLAPRFRRALSVRLLGCAACAACCLSGLSLKPCSGRLVLIDGAWVGCYMRRCWTRSLSRRRCSRS